MHVRGGDAYEVGYEFDGIPVNRAFDNYPSGALSSLGQQELQVYTGATPANGEAQGLAGFVNQVIKSGTYPGFASVELSAGSPAFYHSISVEAGGASPNRLFSYYVGLSGANKDFRYVDQSNGQSYASEFGPILGSCFAGLPDSSVFASCYTNGQPNVSGEAAGGPVPGYILGPIPYGNYTTNLFSRDNVLNLHFGIPHKGDTGRDDVQLLYEDEALQTALYNSGFDMGIPSNPNDPLYAAFNNAFLVPFYSDYYTYAGASGTLLPANYASLVQPYLFPSSPSNRQFGSQIALAQRDVQYNDQGIVKLQYQKNFGSDSYLRLYGYSYYSDYISTGPVSSYEFTGFDSGDYELNAHTRGVSAEFAKQFGSHHLRADSRLVHYGERTAHLQRAAVRSVRGLVESGRQLRRSRQSVGSRERHVLCDTHWSAQRFGDPDELQLDGGHGNLCIVGRHRRRNAARELSCNGYGSALVRKLVYVRSESMLVFRRRNRRVRRIQQSHAVLHGFFRYRPIPSERQTLHQCRDPAGPLRLQR